MSRGRGGFAPPAVHPATMRLAAIELSDRRVRMLVAEGSAIVARDEATVPAFEAIDPSHRRRFLTLLETLRGRALALGVERIVAVATGALRRARGMASLQAILPGRLGFELLIPSAVEER